MEAISATSVLLTDTEEDWECFSSVWFTTKDMSVDHADKSGNTKEVPEKPPSLRLLLYSFLICAF